MRRKGPKKQAQKKYELVDRSAQEGKAAYALFEKIRKAYHDHTRDAKMVLAWMIGKKADRDGVVTLGRCRKAGELDRQLSDFDFIILLNREHWKSFDERQRSALLDHELCHADVSVDSDGEPKVDGHQRKLFRVRKHDIEEFGQVVHRHGIYKADLERFVESLRTSKQGDLFQKPQKAAA